MEKILISACLAGAKVRYDGNFTRTIIDGDGVTAHLLKQEGIEVFCKKEISLVIERLKIIENL